MFGAMAAMLVVAFAVPGAFGADAALFAVAFLIVRLLNLALYAVAGQRTLMSCERSSNSPRSPRPDSR